MPQKSNPVLPSLLSAIATQTVGLNSVMQSALVHRQERDAAAWITEWMSLPQMMILAARSLSVAREIAEGLEPDLRAMADHIRNTDGVLFAEALSFVLSETMTRHEAQAEVKTLIALARKTNRPLPDVVRERYGGADLDAVFDPSAQLGTAPDEARRFAARAKSASA
jgi:3-carboxy-cis,cis-muconate cycloisomerase